LRFSILLLILLIPFVSATYDYSINNESYRSNFTGTLNLNKVIFTKECRDQYNTFLSQQPEQLVKEYCETSNYKLAVLAFFVLIMLILEPYVRKRILDYKIDNVAISSNSLIFMYRWLLAGLVFMLMYSNYLLS